MIIRKILKLEDDPTRRPLRGSSADESKALKELTRKGRRFKIIGGSKHASKSNPRGRARLIPAVAAGAKPRARHEHKRDAKALTEYLIEGEHKGEHPDGKERVNDAFSYNVLHYEDGQQLEATEIRKVGSWMGESAALNTRARKSAFTHYVVSLHDVDTDKATPEFWRDVGGRMLNVLKMDEHQALFVVHEDTDNRHMHVMVNRVHPTLHTVVDPLADLVRLEAFNRALEKEYGLKVDRGRHIDPETGETYDWDKVRRGEISVPKNRSRASKNDEKKFASQVKVALKEKGEKPFSDASSWADLEARLAEHRYYLEAEGAGLKLYDAQGRSAKVSAVAGKGNGRRKLEERFECDWTDYQADKATAASEGIGVDEAASMRQAETQRQAVLRQVELDRQARDTKEERRLKIETLLKGRGVWFADSSVPGEVELGGQPIGEFAFSDIAKDMSEKEIKVAHNITGDLNRRMSSLYEQQEGLHVGQREHDTMDVRGVMVGSERALKSIEAIAHARDIELNPSVGPVAAPLEAKPVRVDVQDLSLVEAKRVWSEWVDKLIKAPDELEELHKVTHAALDKAGEIPTPQERVKQKRLLKEGLKVISLAAKEVKKGNPFLQFSFMKKKPVQTQKMER